jgi:gas vesicle protein
MKKLDWLHIILFILIIGGLLFFYNKNNPPPPHLYNPYKSQLDSLSQVIKEYEIKNQYLENEYQKTLEISEIYTNQIDSLNNSIKNNRKYYEKQIQNLKRPTN